MRASRIPKLHNCWEVPFAFLFAALICLTGAFLPAFRFAFCAMFLSPVRRVLPRSIAAYVELLGLARDRRSWGNLVSPGLS